MESWSEADKAHALKWAQEKAPKTKDEYFRGIADFCKRTSPSDRVCLDSKIDNKLYSLWRENAAVPNDSPYLKREEKTYGIPSDLLFARTIPLKDCDIWVDETSEPGGVVVKYRVVIFEHYDKQIDIAAKFIEEGILKDPPPILVGCIIVDKGYFKFYLPIHIIFGSDFVCSRDDSFIYANGKYASATEATNMGIEEIRIYGNQLLLTWYSIQISLLHPQIKCLYKIDDPKIRNSKKKKSKQTKRHTKLIRKMYLNEEDVDRVINPKKNVNWKTLVWYVCGHFRHYKTGRTIFIQPYWKGALREVKRNLDEGRDREIAV